MQASTEQTLIIACGALAKELTTLLKLNQLTSVKIRCLPAKLHNRPDKIPQAVRDLIHQKRGRYDRILVAYGDCGTGGLLDNVLEEEGVERLPGAHCYEFFAGDKVFADMADAEIGTFYLTDFLVQHFERLIINGLGLDKHPQLKDIYFSHYKKLVFLDQFNNPIRAKQAEEAAEYLGVAYERHYTGLKTLDGFIQQFNKGEPITWQS